MKRITIPVIIIILVLVAVGASAQNLLTDNPYYKQAQDFKAQARQAFNDGRYDDAIQYSQRAQELTQQAQEYAQKMLAKYKANGWKNRAQERIAYAKDINAEKYFPDEYANAQDFYGKAQQLFNSEQYDQSIQASRNAIDALANIRPVQQQVTSGETLPKYYTVRLIPDNRDCFWKIAGYSFVYNDPWKWKVLYEANKDKLQDPNNPDLIQPGQVFVIPSIKGEDRTGMWGPRQ